MERAAEKRSGRRISGAGVRCGAQDRKLVTMATSVELLSVLNGRAVGTCLRAD